ncbi:hypothetical protein [Hirschia litorea]|uniref:Uncharacterized protein n=1 Tax=Hirschia litorea TaxID=1199156 RepID=A0ABW2IKX9_9PROT
MLGVLKFVHDSFGIFPLDSRPILRRAVISLIFALSMSILINLRLHLYALNYGARLHFEGIAFAAYFSFTVAFFTAFLSFTFVSTLPPFVEVIRNHFNYQKFDSSSLPLKIRMILFQFSALFLSFLILFLFINLFSLIDGVFSTFQYFKLTFLFAGGVAIFFAIPSSPFFGEASKWPEYYASFVALIIVVASIYVVAIRSFETNLKSIGYGGGRIISIKMDNGETYSNVGLFLRSNGYFTVYDNKKNRFIELQKLHVSEIRYSPSYFEGEVLPPLLER